MNYSFKIESCTIVIEIYTMLLKQFFLKNSMWMCKKKVVDMNKKRYPIVVINTNEWWSWHKESNSNQINPNSSIPITKSLYILFKKNKIKRVIRFLFWLIVNVNVKRVIILLFIKIVIN